MVVYVGCDVLAKAIAAGEAPANACPVGGARLQQRLVQSWVRSWRISKKTVC
ncbi:MAG: (Fe-S)-binding protein [Lachnospira pectinoschiza]